jgi:hypothetical protein
MKDDSGEISPRLVPAIIRLARGLFTQGLHLNLVPTNDDRQEWTLVGSIGHYAEGEPAEALPDMSLAGGSNVVRGRTAQYINAFMNLIGGIGFADVPQFPVFSVVPFAVYRAIPRSALAQSQLESSPQT